MLGREERDFIRRFLAYDGVNVTLEDIQVETLECEKAIFHKVNLKLGDGRRRGRARL